MADSLMVYAWRLEEMADAAALTKSQRDNLLDVAAVLREQPGEPQGAAKGDKDGYAMLSLGDCDCATHERLWEDDGQA